MSTSAEPSNDGPRVTPYSPWTAAVVSAAAYGLADFFGGLASRRASPLSVLTGVYLGGLLLLGPLAFLVPSPPAWPAIGWGAMAGVVGAAGLGFLYRALAVGSMSAVAPIAALVGVIVPVFVDLLGGATLNARTAGGGVMGMLAVVLLARRERSGPSRGTGQGLGLAIGAGMAIGAYFALYARAGPSSGVWPVVASRAAGLSLFIALSTARRRPFRLPPAARRPVALAAILDGLGATLLFVALTNGPLGPVAILTSLYPAATVVMAVFVLKERLTRGQGVGLVFAAAATVLLVTSS